MLPDAGGSWPDRGCATASIDVSQPALTLVSAAAGFGKTTLVADWFADGPATAWLSLDRRDNDPTLFWTYVVAALQSVDPGRRSRGPTAPRAPQPSHRCRRRHVAQRPAGRRQRLVLVLDDYHVIESPEIHESVAFLLEHLPPHVHLVIASRADPPLPLARCGPAASSWRSGRPTCASPPTKRPRTSTTRWA